MKATATITSSSVNAWPKRAENRDKRRWLFADTGTKEKSHASCRSLKLAIGRCSPHFSGPFLKCRRPEVPTNDGGSSVKRVYPDCHYFAVTIKQVDNGSVGSTTWVEL